MPSAASPPTQRLQFRLAGGAQPLMLIPVRVNEQGPFEFILDTGAGTSLISPELAVSLHIASTDSRPGQTAGGTVQVALAQLDSLAVGEARQENVQVAIMDLGMIGRAVGAKLDGDLGYNFLKRFRLTIDYRALELTLEDPKRVEYLTRPARAEVPMRLAHPAKPLILIDVLIGERGPYQFAIDTGTSTSALSAELAREIGLQGSPIGPVTTGSGQIQMLAARLPSLRVGGAQIEEVDCVIGDFLSMLSQACGCKLDGIVGYNFLRHYRVVIDYPNERFRLE